MSLWLETCLSHAFKVYLPDKKYNIMAISMTGYGKNTCRVNDRNINIELKALNSKTFDLFLKLPQFLKEKEGEIRSLLAEKLMRGKTELIVTFDNTDDKSNFSLNKNLFKQYYNALKELADELDAPTGDSLIGAIIRMPDVLTPQADELGKEQWEGFKNSLLKAIDELVNFRMSEGMHLKTDILKSIKKIGSLMEQVKPFEEERTERIKQKLSEAVAKLPGNFQADDNRLEQEMIYYLEKLDINEEKVRLVKHLEYFTEIIEKEENCGKKLGFVSQEIGREINTLGSKAQHADMQKIVVQMKDELEQIKEQLLNVL